MWGLTNEIDSTLKHYQLLLEQHKNSPEMILPYSPDRIQAYYEKKIAPPAINNESPKEERPKLTLIKNETPLPAATTPADMAAIAVVADAPAAVGPSTEPLAVPQQEAQKEPQPETQNPHDYFKENVETMVELRKKISRYVDAQFVHPGYAILYDINCEDISFFTEHPFLPGQEIVIEFGIAKTFTVQAEVVYIKNFQGRSRLIQAWRPNCRIKAKIMAQHPGDRTLLREFLMSVDTKSQSRS